MSNENSYSKMTFAVAAALIVMTASVGFQLAHPALAQEENITEEVGQMVENATGNQTGNQSGGPLEQLGEMLGFGGGQ
jgi:hypothetical protein